MPRPLTIGPRTFTSIAEAARFYSAMLNRYPLFARVTDDDAASLRDLLDRHPDRDAKLRGTTATHFEVHPFKGGTRCFFLIRSDGTKIDFSFKKCLK
jgi:hypothetical protein